MTTYAEFQEYYLRAIWRVGDADLQADLPKLMKEAEARINRDLKHTRLANSDTENYAFPGLIVVALPADFSEMISVVLGGDSYPCSVLPLSEIQKIQGEINEGKSLDKSLTVYGIAGDSLYAPSASDTGASVFMTYYIKVPAYEDLAVGQTSFYDKYPDFYIAALNVQVYNYLRDFNLSGEYNGKYTDILESMQRDSHYTMFPSGQLGQAMMPDNVK